MLKKKWFWISLSAVVVLVVCGVLFLIGYRMYKKDKAVKAAVEETLANQTDCWVKCIKIDKKKKIDSDRYTAKAVFYVTEKREPYETIKAFAPITYEFVDDSVNLETGEIKELPMTQKDKAYAAKKQADARREATEKARIAPEKCAEMEKLTGVLLVQCPAGSFMMGSPSYESDRDGDEAQHHVTLTKPFWIGKYEVTQAEYEKVMGNNPSRFKGAERPVECVSWDDAMAYCEKLNQLTEGKRSAGYKFSLPTEAQWEYACRAGSTGAYAGDLDSMGWYCGNSGDQTHGVGQKRPNAWGIYDMHGNVWEWCLDWYGKYNGDATDPVGPASGSSRVDRGGSWGGSARGCRSAIRYGYGPGSHHYYLGFRVALVPVQ